MADKCLNGCGTTVHKPTTPNQRSYYPLCKKCARRAQVRVARIEARRRRAPQEADDGDADE